MSMLGSAVVNTPLEVDRDGPAGAAQLAPLQFASSAKTLRIGNPRKSRLNELSGRGKKMDIAGSPVWSAAFVVRLRYPAGPGATPVHVGTS